MPVRAEAGSPPPLPAGWQFIDTGENTGAFNMRFDEMLADRLLKGPGAPTLRLFRWKPWAVSLGYNQESHAIDAAKCAGAGIDVVRRPTGGRAILHAEELTYSVVMTAGHGAVLDVYNRISGALVRGLKMFGVDASLNRSQPDFARVYRMPSAVACFTSSARYEIQWNGRKLVGSAQRRYRAGPCEVVLQHGSILTGAAHRRLAELLPLSNGSDPGRLGDALRENTTDLREILGRPIDGEELAGCIRRGFEQEWGIQFTHEAQSYAENT